VIALLAAAAVAPPPLERLRFARTVRPAGAGEVTLVPDGAMYGHARPDFADVRVVDARGDQVPWRPAPEPPVTSVRRLPVRNIGRAGGAAVALVDRGPTRTVLDRVSLEVPDSSFVGSVTALGSDDRRTWIRLSTTQIYSVGGAQPARSTTALLPPTDFRYLQLRATHVTRIDGVVVAAVPRQPSPVPLRASVRSGASVVVVDLGHRVPVDELRIAATARRYDRAFTVSANGAVVAAGRLVRTDSARETVVPLTVRARVLRIRIANGDDPPLPGISVEARARPRVLLLEAGHAGPYMLYYGGSVRPPVYEFALLPPSARADRPQRSALGAERPNPHYHVVDTRSIFARHRSLVTAALALAAAVMLAAGALALRRTA
jgi:Protein of unknown function (DUF3999)